MVTEAMDTPKATINSTLSGEHLAALTRAVTNTLETDIAEETFAQIIDGLPIAAVALDSTGDTLPRSHPVYHKHKDLCHGVVEKAREFRDRFDPGSLQADATLISDFRASSPGSRVFKARLVELTAIAIHEIAVQLFNLELGGHADDDIATWVPEKDDIFWRWYEGPWPTLFRHTWYTAYDKYPLGIADGVGFWAEARIFGGVVLFDRRAPPRGDPDSVWFHPDREGGTYRIFQLLDEQRLRFLEFLTSATPDLKLLPIIAGKRNINREDPEERTEKTGIYRHRWDRKPLARFEPDARMKDVWNNIDYPTRSDWDRAQERAYDRDHRMYQSDDDEYGAGT